LLESFGRTVSETGVAQTGLHALTVIVERLHTAVDNTLEGRKKRLEQQINEIQFGLGGYVGRVGGP